MVKAKDLFALSGTKEEKNDPAWLHGAEEGMEYLKSNINSEEIILYASFDHVLVNGLLAPVAKVDPLDADDILRSYVMPDSTWHIEHSYTFTREKERVDTVYLASPFDDPGSNSLVGGEKLIFRRSLTGVDKQVRNEVSQKLVHALNLYWLEEHEAFCRLDDQGDIEKVIRVETFKSEDRNAWDVIITIRTEDLQNYMIVTETALIQKFDFTRYGDSFRGWSNQSRIDLADGETFYNGGLQANGSYINGFNILMPSMTHEQQALKFRAESEKEGKQYASFKAHDWKNDKLLEISCAPEALSNYFQHKSTKPFELSPAYFKPDVLIKYKNNSEKYTLEHRSISCRNAWHLKSYDVNEAGQVHTYLIDLQRLPYEEQLYWKSYNEWPKGGLSKRAIENDFKGEFSSDYDPLLEIRSKVQKLDNERPHWWIPRGEGLKAKQHYPITTSPDEWAEAILSLDQFIIEGFQPTELRKVLDGQEIKYEKNWLAIKLIMALIEANGNDAEEASKIMQPFTALHFLRTKVKGHSGSEKDQIIQESRKMSGSLKEHFSELCSNCDTAFNATLNALGFKIEDKK